MLWSLSTWRRGSSTSRECSRLRVIAVQEVLAEGTGLIGIDLDCGVRMGWPEIEVPESED